MNQFLTTGRRKEAVARVRLQSGKGKFTVNGQELADYLCRSTLVDHACEPLKLTENYGTADVSATTSGGQPCSGRNEPGSSPASSQGGHDDPGSARSRAEEVRSAEST